MACTSVEPGAWDNAQIGTSQSAMCACGGIGFGFRLNNRRRAWLRSGVISVGGRARPYIRHKMTDIGQEQIRSKRVWARSPSPTHGHLLPHSVPAHRFSNLGDQQSTTLRCAMRAFIAPEQEDQPTRGALPRRRLPFATCIDLMIVIFCKASSGLHS